MTTVNVAALVVAIVSALIALGAVWYARQSAAAAATTAALDVQRRQAELTPRFRVTCERPPTAAEILHLGVVLVGPPQLEGLDPVGGAYPG